MCWQLGLRVIPHHWSLLTCPLLASVLCHQPLPQQHRSGMNAYSLFRERLGYSLQLFRQNVDNVSLNSVIRLAFLSGSLPPCSLKSYSWTSRLSLMGHLVATWNGSASRSHIWGPWLETWQFGIDQVGCMFGICQFLCPFIVWLSVPFSLCFKRALCTSCLYVWSYRAASALCSSPAQTLFTGVGFVVRLPIEHGCRLF